MPLPIYAEPLHPPEVFLHLRVLVGVVLGLGLTRLLSGIASIVQHPRSRRLYPAHLVWVAVALVLTVHFWWWEFGLAAIRVWRFENYCFVLGFAFLHYLVATLLFPEKMDDYGGYEDYFISRRAWFFGILVVYCGADWTDTYLKGPAYVAALGPEYPTRLLISAPLFLAAGITANRRFHAALPVVFLVYYLSWIGRVYDILG